MPTKSIFDMDAFEGYGYFGGSVPEKPGLPRGRARKGSLRIKKIRTKKGITLGRAAIKAARKVQGAVSDARYKQLHSQSIYKKSKRDALKERWQALKGKFSGSVYD